MAAPSGAAGWTAVICGMIGMWLVPGVWLSALVVRAGRGPAARLATRIGTTLAWYALVGPVIHASAQDVRITTGGIFGFTVAATVAVCLGVALGLLRRPSDPGLRVLVAAFVGAIMAQNVIGLAMVLFPDGVNYEPISHLNWLIVLSCAALTAIGVHSRPDLPPPPTVRHLRVILVCVAVIAATTALLIALGSRWSPAQKMPSAFGIEQVAAPAGIDVAFGVTAIGPDGPHILHGAEFIASDDLGRPVPAEVRLIPDDDTWQRATLLVVLDPAGRPALCVPAAEGEQPPWPARLTVRDRESGVLVQGVIPDRWCAP